MSLVEKPRENQVVAVRPLSGFAQLPQELLFKILEEADDTAIFSCAEALPSLKTAGIDILLQRNGVQDPSTYCEVQAIIPGDVSRRPLPDALSALLISDRHLTSIKHFHCSIRAPLEYDGRLDSRNANEKAFMAGPGPLVTRMKYTFERLSAVLGRADGVEEVTLKLVDWAKFPPSLSPLLEELLHTLIRKGCSTLQVLCPGAPFDERPWNFPVPVSVPPSRSRGLTLSSMLSNFCGFFSSPTARESFRGHQRLGSSPPLSLHPRITHLNVDSTLFHPSGLQWMTDLLAQSPLTSFSVSMDPCTPPSWFTYHGLPALVKGVPRLQSMSVLNASVKDIVNIAPKLRPFAALKNLTLTLNNSCCTPGDFQGSAVPFAPAKLQRLSVASGLVDYMLLGTVTALNLQEVEITYGKIRCAKAKTIADDVASVRDFFDKISVPISIGVKLPCAGPQIEVSSTHDDGGRDIDGAGRWVLLYDPLSLRFVDEMKELGEKSLNDPLRIETLCLELYPRTLRHLKPPHLDRIVALAECFPSVKKVVLEGVRDFRETRNPQGETIPELARAVVQPVYSRCRSLTSLWIGEEEYERPLLEI